MYCNVKGRSHSCLSKSKQDQTIFERAVLSDGVGIFGFAALQYLLCINICPPSAEREEKKKEEGMQK